jgi:hypothetical protein
MVPNMKCCYIVTFVTSSKQKPVKNTTTDYVGSSIAESWRCCALSDRTFSKMLALASITHYAVMLSATHYCLPHITAQRWTALQGADLLTQA